MPSGPTRSAFASPVSSSSGPRISVEFIAAGDDFIAAGQILGCALQLAVGATIGLVELRLQKLPLHLDLVRLAVAPILVAWIIGVVGHQVAKFDFIAVVAGGADFLHPRGGAEFQNGRRGRRFDDGLDARGRARGWRDVGKRRRGDVDGGTAHQPAGAVVHQPMVCEVGGRAAIADAEVFPSEIDRGIGEPVPIRRRDGAGGDGCVGCPSAVGGLRAGVADDHFRMQRAGVVLGDLGRAVVVPVVGVSNVLAVDVLNFNLKAVTLHAGVVHGVEVIDGAVGGAGAGDTTAERHEAARDDEALKAAQDWWGDE